MVGVVEELRSSMRSDRRGWLERHTTPRIDSDHVEKACMTDGNRCLSE